MRPRFASCLWTCALSGSLGLAASSLWAQELPVEGEVRTFTEELRLKHRDDESNQSVEDAVKTARLKHFGQFDESVPEALRLRYDSAFQAFRQKMADLRLVYLRHQSSLDMLDDRKRLEEYCGLLSQAHANLMAWRDCMAEIQRYAPEKAGPLSETIVEMIERDVEHDHFEGLVEMARSVMDDGTPLTPQVLDAIGFVGYANCHFDLAEEAWNRLLKRSELPEPSALLLASIVDLRPQWEAEQKYRLRDQENDNNPRVLITTNKGAMVVELFEDQAPQAVANFIYLVERRFYDKKLFFRVLERSLVQTGCERADGSGNAGYTIRGEMNLPEHRSVFRGSLVLMAGTDGATKNLDPDSGSSQFYISILPQPWLDGQMTVFGRVIEGLNVLGALQRIDYSDAEQRKDKSKSPDVLVEAKVLRKREHAYVPEPVHGRLPGTR